MGKERILVVDDEQGVRNTLTSILEDEGYDVDSVESGEECLNALKKENYQAIMLDVWLPGIDGVETLKKMKGAGIEPTVVMISGHGTVETAVKATKLGAFDFIEKPLSLEKIILVLRNAIRHRKLLDKHKILKEQLKKDVALVGNSQAVRQLRKDIETAAPTDSPVFISGENGSGKELAARMIHFHSRRSDEAFISINCAAFDGEMLEQELFGYEKGAFLWATKGKKGKFELANEGSLFLDEITHSSVKDQIQILRVLEEKNYEPRGGEKVVHTDVRLIVASNEDCEELIRAGKFREELFYKLNIVSLRIPPLRERRDDIMPLVEHFLREFSYEYGRTLKSVSREALSVLTSYRWPGNVRELKNTIERLVIMLKKDTIELSDLAEGIRSGSAPDRQSTFKSLNDAVAEFERMYLQDVLRHTHLDRKRAAEIMKIEIHILEEKLKILGIDARNLLDS